jgi:signal transduction histidine kinase
MRLRGPLFRLATWYFLLLALILAFFNVIVYFTLSEALNARVMDDLKGAVNLAENDLTVSGDSINPSLQLLNDPNYTVTCVWVYQLSSRQQVFPSEKSTCGLGKLDAPVAAAIHGQTTEIQAWTDQQLFMVHTEPLMNKANKIVGVLEVGQPMSWVNDSLSRLERQLALASTIGIILGALVAVLMAQKSIRPLTYSLQRQREFVADASHELRTPLTLIRTNAEAWLRRSHNVREKVYAENILEEVDQLSTIVRDLTTLALADAKQLPLERKPIELNQMVEELVVHTKPLADERGVSLRPELNGGASVEADPQRVRQLLLILLDNALTHTPSGGQVSIAVGRQNGRATVAVNDTGSGISAEDLPHVFDRFYRADKARGSDSGGSGLGLAIAKWIVEAHRGDIEITSTTGQGTQVRVSLPAQN